MLDTRKNKQSSSEGTYRGGREGTAPMTMATACPGDCSGFGKSRASHELRRVKMMRTIIQVRVPGTLFCSRHDVKRTTHRLSLTPVAPAVQVFFFFFFFYPPADW